eukprot:TRINITY_DN4414_c0_g1_i1.p1 TRINITY_DN4414_c0_g1~~TRINITY_DN4414_c0_g1_i1.p1  ORF type:complete len:266 (-),score=64.99 TRINITY_DN4414_c0_g1_i1:19-816(-)
MEAGNLVSHMKTNYQCRAPTSLADDLSEDVIIGLAKGISAGMDHLHQNKIVHRDLAARNILIQLKLMTPGIPGRNLDDTYRMSRLSQTHNQKIIPKISDFGLAGGEKRKRKIPIRWTAPEVLLDSSVANEKTDIWSFGIVMYEISVACHFLPYSNLPNTNVKKFVIGGNQVSLPSEGVSPELSSLIKACLNYNPQFRPSFSSVHEQLRLLQESLVSELIQEKGDSEEAPSLFLSFYENVGSGTKRMSFRAEKQQNVSLIERLIEK